MALKIAKQMFPRSDKGRLQVPFALILLGAAAPFSSEVLPSSVPFRVVFLKDFPIR